MTNDQPCDNTQKLYCRNNAHLMNIVGSFNKSSYEIGIHAEFYLSFVGLTLFIIFFLLTVISELKKLHTLCSKHSQKRFPGAFKLFWPRVSWQVINEHLLQNLRKFFLFWQSFAGEMWACLKWCSLFNVLPN